MTYAEEQGGDPLSTWISGSSNSDFPTCEEKYYYDGTEIWWNCEQYKAERLSLLVGAVLLIIVVAALAIRTQGEINGAQQ